MAPPPATGEQVPPLTLLCLLLLRLTVALRSNDSVTHPDATAWSSTANTGTSWPCRLAAGPLSRAFSALLTCAEQPGPAGGRSSGLQTWTSVTCSSAIGCTAARRQQEAARSPTSPSPSETPRVTLAGFHGRGRTLLAPSFLICVLLFNRNKKRSSLSPFERRK